MRHRKDRFAFCETITAPGGTPWHIRELSKEGLKLGGGADTLSLCGRKVAWDIGVAIGAHCSKHICDKCWTAYQKAVKE